MSKDRVYVDSVGRAMCRIAHGRAGNEHKMEVRLSRFVMLCLFK